MFRKILKWVGILLAGLVALLIIGLISLYFITMDKLNKVYEIPPSGITVSSDAESIARGKHLVIVLGQCTGCHQENLAGTVDDQGFMVARLVTPNLTSGKGGVGSHYTDEDWVRAIRHGVKPDGKPGIAMFSQGFYNFSDTDVADIVAYVKSVPPVDKEYPRTRLGPMAWLFLLQAPDLLPAQIIDHNAPRNAPEPGVTAQYGEYLTIFCHLCHGPDLSGGIEPGSGPNLTPGGELGGWSEADFITALRSGVTPSGKNLDPDMMPWKQVGQMTDDELKAIWLYLQSLPTIKTTPVPTLAPTTSSN
jgi:mono/diheme cytochrome c family protein